MAGGARDMPRWADLALLPALNLASALVVAGLVIAVLGENPLQALGLLIYGSVGYGEAIGFTLYYATNFVFTGLAVAVAFHAGLFNIGGEGQAYIGGLGAGLVCLFLGFLPPILVVPLGVIVSALFGAAWAYVPGYLQARRGSHIVITTIMFNFLAAALMTYLMVNLLIKPGQQSPESREFDPGTWMPFVHEIAAKLGVAMAKSPLNLSILLAVGVSALVWAFLWRTRWGYALRVVGHNETAAIYGGIAPARVIVGAMALSGALAGLVGVNEIMGVQHRLILNFTGGVGYVGIAVALMGRNHPVGIALSALLFGALYQGGAELSFDMPRLTKEVVVVIQGLVILFCGAFEAMFRPHLAQLFRRRAPAPA
ncbi:MAG: ABC transporter permease [Rhodospirillales bacterium]